MRADENPVLILEGKMTINNVGRVEKEINQFIIDNSFLKVNLNSVEEVDVSFLQLLYSSCEYVSNNTETEGIQIVGEIPDCMLAGLKITGFDDKINFIRTV